MDILWRLDGGTFFQQRMSGKIKNGASILNNLFFTKIFGGIRYFMYKTDIYAEKNDKISLFIKPYHFSCVFIKDKAFV